MSLYLNPCPHAPCFNVDPRQVAPTRCCSLFSLASGLTSHPTLKQGAWGRGLRRHPLLKFGASAEAVKAVHVAVLFPSTVQSPLFVSCQVLNKKTKKLLRTPAGSLHRSLVFIFPLPTGLDVPTLSTSINSGV